MGFSRVSIPFGWAKKPLVERVHAWDPKLDVTFIYGARSWVDSQPGYETKNHRHDNYVDVQVRKHYLNLTLQVFYLISTIL